MQIPTHILSGWCAGNLVDLTPGQRLRCMIAATIADFDGLGILFGTDYYFKYHHVVGHGFFVGALIAIALERIDRGGLRVGVLYFLLFCLHLLLDSFGSGIGWGLELFWPISNWHFINPYAWDFQGWQNMAALFIVSIGTWVIAQSRRRTPFEKIWPKLEVRLVSRPTQPDSPE